MVIRVRSFRDSYSSRSWYGPESVFLLPCMSVNSSGYRIRRYFPVLGPDVMGTDNARWAKDQPVEKAIIGKIGIQSDSDV